VMVVTNFDPSEFVPLLDRLPEPQGETSDE